MKAQTLLKKIQLSQASQEKLQQFHQLQRFQRIIEHFSLCALCKNPLRFVYFKQKPQSITERAHCDACEKSTSTRSYPMN